MLRIDALIEMVKGNREIADWATEEDLETAHRMVAAEQKQSEAYANRPGKNYYWDGEKWMHNSTARVEDAKNRWS